MMTTNLFVITNVKQFRTGGSFRILLPFFRTSWGVGVLNSAIFNSLTIGLSLARFWRAFGILGGGGLNPNSPPPRYANDGMSHYEGQFEIRQVLNDKSSRIYWPYLIRQRTESTQITV